MIVSRRNLSATASPPAGRALLFQEAFQWEVSYLTKPIPYHKVRKLQYRKDLELATATMTSKGQITIPMPVRRALGVDAGDRIEFVETEKGQFAIIAATRSVKELKGLFRGKRSKPVSIEEMNSAIAKRASGSR